MNPGCLKPEGIRGVDSPAGAEKDRPEGRHNVGLALLTALRPRQWIKNGLVFLPFLFAVDLAWNPSALEDVPALLFQVLLAALAFCALSGGVYLFNDLLDRESDRNHPTKRHRPLASGQVGTALALSSLFVLSLAGVAVLALVKPLLGAVGILYLSINLVYSLGFKRLVVIDVLLVASGYVIRTVVGALVIGVDPSPWLYTTTGAAALFVVLGKRYAEVRLAGEDQGAQRHVLRQYPPAFVGQLLNISAGTALVSYALYTIEAANLPDNDAMLLTIPLVCFGLFRFLYLVHTSDQAEYPELLIAKDLPMVLSVLAWLIVAGAVLLLYGGP